jgi:hypothetical protein
MLKLLRTRATNSSAPTRNRLCEPFAFSAELASVPKPSIGPMRCFAVDCPAQSYAEQDLAERARSSCYLISDIPQQAHVVSLLEAEDGLTDKGGEPWR